MRFLEVAEIVGEDYESEEQFDQHLAQVMEFGRHLGIYFQFISDRVQVDDGYEVGNLIVVDPCLQDYMAGQVCTLPAGHEGSHR